MAKVIEIQEVNINDLKPYERNAKKHSDEQIEMIAKSIQEFGFISPVLIDKELNIIAGHGRVLAGKSLSLETVPCVFVEGLTEEQRRAYILADNKLTELGGWDFLVLEQELDSILDIDMSDFGFGDDEHYDETGLGNFFADSNSSKSDNGKQIQCPHCGEWFEA